MPTSLSDIKVKNSTSTLIIKPDDITINGVSIVGQNSFADRDLSNLSTTGQAVLNAKANNNDVVHKTGNEAIADIKTFTSTVTRNHEFSGSSARTLTDVDTNGKGNIAIIPYYTGNKIYHRTYAENKTSGKHAYLDVTVDDSGNAGLQYSGNASTFNINFTNATQVNVPTPATSDNSTKIATTANVDAKITAQAVKLTGDQTIEGTKIFNKAIKTKGGFDIINSVVTKGTNPASTQYWGLFRANDVNHTGSWQSTRLGIGEVSLDTSGNTQLILGVYRNEADSAANSVIAIRYDSNGSRYATLSVTPATSDSSTKIATTAYMNNKLQVVSALPASPDSSVFYFIPA